MNGIVLPKSDIMRSSAGEIDQICQVLARFGVNFFSHTRVYDDGSFIDMSNHAGMIDHFYYQTDVYKHYTPDVSPELLRDGYFLCATIPHNPAVVACRETLGIDQILVLKERCHDHYQIWNFGTYCHNPDINSFYLNHLDILKSFTYFFKDRAVALIEQFEQDKIVRPTMNTAPLAKELEAAKQSFYSEVTIERFFIDDKVYLTMREAECIYWLAKGKSPSEIAIILSCAQRTAETHINNAKNKLQCYKQTTLVRAAVNFGIYDYFDNKLNMT